MKLLEGSERPCTITKGCIGRMTAWTLEQQRGLIFRCPECKSIKHASGAEAEIAPEEPQQRLCTGKAILICGKCGRYQDVCNCPEEAPLDASTTCLALTRAATEEN